MNRPQLTDEQLLDLVQERTFRFFWERTSPFGLVPDRWPTPSFSSVAAVGFALTAYPVGAERGWIDRTAAADRTLTTLKFFIGAPKGPEPAGKTTYRGFVYHFLDMKFGQRFEKVELSTMDTAILLAGALFAQSYFDDPRNKVEQQIRDLAEALYRRAEFDFFFERPPLLSMAWTPEDGLHDWDYTGYNEAMILYLLGLGSPTHPIGPESWKAYTNTYKWETYYGQEHVNFAPLFGHQFTHIWIDFRGIQDEYMRAKGIDYFENSRRATLAQRSYAIENPNGWKGYGPDIWGLSASDGPFDGYLDVKGKRRQFFTYAARGAAAHEVRDDGTIAPYAAISSLPFTPQESMAALRAMYEKYGEHIFGQYGFLDAFNPTIDFNHPVKMGRVVPGVTWVDGDYLGIDQGPLLLMMENHRSEFVWKTMKKNPHIVRGLKRAGFTGGWLENAR